MFPLANHIPGIPARPAVAWPSGAQWLRRPVLPVAARHGILAVRHRGLGLGEDRGFFGSKCGKRHDKFMGNQHVLWRFHGRYNPKSEINKFMMILYQLIFIYYQHEPIWHHWGVPENGAYRYIPKKKFNGDKPWDFRVTYFRQTHLFELCVYQGMLMGAGPHLGNPLVNQCFRVPVCGTIVSTPFKTCPETNWGR